MASRPKGYGLTAEVKGKIDGKYDGELGESSFETLTLTARSRMP